MNTNSPSPGWTPGRATSGGFSLIELMIVVGIVGVLTAIVAAALPGIQNRIKRNSCEALVSELGMSIERYQLDHGIYPQNPADQPPEEGAHILYVALSGDQDLDGLPDDDVKMYNENLSIEKSKRGKTQRVAYDGAKRLVIIDGFGSYIRYHADPPGRVPIRTNNPTFDLWSLGGAPSDSTEDKDVNKWITNWD